MLWFSLTKYQLFSKVELYNIIFKEKIKYNFNQQKFSELISNNSKVQVINIKDQNDLKNFFKKNLFDNEMIICMGAGSISNWIRNISKEL